MKTKLLLICAMLALTGCTTTRITMGEAQVDTTYFLQEKDIKLIEYTAPDGSTLRVESFGSETAEVVGAAIRAGLGAR